MAMATPLLCIFLILIWTTTTTLSQTNGNKCTVTKQIEVGGELMSYDVEECCTGWGGTNCDVPICENGGCQNGGTCSGPDVCDCLSDYTGQYCEQPICDPSCEHGTCNSPDSCVCDLGYDGTLCDQAICDKPCNNGKCGAPNTCECNDGWTGTDCLTAYCSKGCENGGECVAPETCKCLPGFDGASCSFDTSSDKLVVTKLSTQLLENHALCQSWDKYYNTFDGFSYTFVGNGTYNLVKDCSDSENMASAYSIYVNRTYSCNDTQPCKVAIKIYTIYHTVILTPGGVLVDNVPVTLPYNIDALRLTQKGAHVVVFGLSELIVMYDQEDNVFIYAPETMQDRVCGLCGNYDGNTTNELLGARGEPKDSIAAWGQAWLDPLEPRYVTRGEVSVLNPCDQLSDAEYIDVKSVCNNVDYKAGPFSACHILVNPIQYRDICEQMMCQCRQTGDHLSCRDTLCEVGQMYSRACTHKGLVLENWRDMISFCPRPTNPDMPGAVHMECGSQCGRTCGGHESQSDCMSSMCVDGFFCPDGTLWDDFACVTPDKCSCKRMEVDYRYPIASTYQSGCDECLCTEGGIWSCTKDAECPGRCQITGDPHYKTFDTKMYAFEAACEYIAVQNGSNFDLPYKFTIYVQNQYCNKIDPTLCTKRITVEVDTGKGVMTYSFRGTFVEVNQVTVGLPYQSTDTPYTVTIRKTSGHMTRMTFDMGLELLWDGMTRIEIILNPKYSGKVMGLCGNFNGQLDDDTMTPTGDITRNITKFAMDWKTGAADCDSSVVEGLGACSGNYRYKDWAESLCNKLKEGQFQRCNNLLDVSPYITQCQNDVCRCGAAMDECECSAMAAYARACLLKEPLLDFQWRTAALCPMNCTGGRVYMECGPNCDQTCSAVQPEPCQEECMEGCNCPTGMAFDEDKGECVRREDCYCLYRRESYPPGHKRAEHCNTCTCSMGQWSCTDLACETLTCPVGQVWSDCADCERTCENRNIQCRQTCLEHKCVCPSDQVRYGDKCVLPSQCPCYVRGQELQNGLSRIVDCNECKCTNGELQCTEKVCSATCSAYGDPHYISFDGKAYEYMGHCTYVLTEDGCNGAEGTFRILAENVPCGATGMSCTKSLKITLHDTVIHMIRGSSPVITRNPAATYATIQAKYNVVEAGDMLYLYTNYGIEIKWDMAMRAYVKLDPQWQNKVCGLCGNYNGNAMDDFRTRDQQVVDKAAVFANSWQTRDYSCTSEITEPVHPCEVNKEREAWAVSACSALRSSVMAPCHDVVDVTEYELNCRWDACGCNKGGDCECLCSAIAAYVTACNTHGVFIRWRNPDLCAIQCEGGQVYKSFGSSCSQQCSDLAKKDAICSETAEGGCYCPEGMAMTNGTCVPKEECPCTHPESGVIIKPYETINDEANCQQCMCYSGQFVCTVTDQCDNIDKLTTTIFTTTPVCQDANMIQCIQPKDTCGTPCNGIKECIDPPDEGNCTTTAPPTATLR